MAFAESNGAWCQAAHSAQHLAGAGREFSSGQVRIEQLLLEIHPDVTQVTAAALLEYELSAVCRYSVDKILER